eukprot:2508735-Alexandrium_andersonii.AAC.1
MCIRDSVATRQRIQCNATNSDDPRGAAPHIRRTGPADRHEQAAHHGGRARAQKRSWSRTRPTPARG